DAITGAALVTGKRYYFAVTTYNYTPDLENPFKTYESVPSVITVIPESPRPGTRYPYAFNQSVEPTGQIGGANAEIAMVVDNPTKQVGDLYTIAFESGTGGVLQYDVTNTTQGITLADNQTDLTGTVPYPDREAGVTFYVGGPPAGLVSLTDQGGQEVFGLESPPTTYGIVNTTQNINDLAGQGRTNRDYEIRFDGVGSYVANLTSAIARRSIWVPFSVWDMGRSSADTPRQVTGAIRDSNTTPTTWNVTVNGMVLDGKARQVFEPIFVADTTYPGDSAGVARMLIPLTAIISDPTNRLSAIHAVFVWDKQRTGAVPPVGTTYKFVKYHELRAGDAYTFQTGAVVTGDEELAKEDITQIKAFPNPYYGVNASETTREVKFITFNHLPAGQTVFRIYNLAGSLVRKLEKNSPDQFFTWDLQNENSLPVASGIYIVYLDMIDLGVTKTLKIAIIQEQQILQRY
ncbi:MAG: hypothetical protein H6Q28_1728, partial [Bacteroidetes bacterium]|nr:hypothetical protein [Bacteroidota bacterium]